MNILYMNWKCLGWKDVCDGLMELGHNVYALSLSEKSHIGIDEAYIEKLIQNIRKADIDVVFSFNYFPTVSEACMRSGQKYLAWIYDNPATKVYDATITNECNHVFSFDSSMVQELNDQGVKTVHYGPLAVNWTRLQKIKVNEEDRKNYACDVAFVGSLYNEEHTFYDRLIKKADNTYLTGYLDGIMEAQRKVYGYNFLGECLTEPFVKTIYEAMPYSVDKGSYTTLDRVYADYVLCRRLAYIERVSTVECLAEKYKVYCYTKNKDVIVGKAMNRGSVDYFTQMPVAFQIAKMNLNMTIRSIKNGIPLRAIDIMGAGGFLLSNYQEDFLKHFVPDQDMVMYSSTEELMDKVKYYLNHETERKQIARNGLDKIKKQFTYTVRLQAMLSTMKE